MSLIETDLQQPTSVSAWLVELVADCLEVPACEIDRQVPLVRYGLDSMSAVHLTTAIADELRCDVPEWLLLDHPDIDSVARYIATARTTRQPLQARKIGQSSLDQMLADSVLPDDVRPARAFQASRTVRTVLLTGATGFLGAYLLRSLLRTKSARVYCLVRPDGHADSRTRIQKNLETKGIWEPSFASRVFAIDGDLLKPEMGLTADRFKDLCRDVDEIFHCAAAVNWVFPYAALRDVNVLGTLELLRLACREKPKRFHFVSSMAVCYSTCGPEEVAEWDDMLPYLKGIHLGYAQSKCVAEALVRRADERGLPVAIYRPSLICGDGQLGVSNTNDFLSSVIKGCIQMGSAPDLDWSLDCCPVDYAADAIVGLSEVSRGSLGVYHVANPSKRHWRELVLWMNLFGYPIKLLSYRNWLAQLQAESTAPEHPLHQLRNFFLTKPREANGVTLPEIYEDGRRSRVSAKRTRKSLSALSFACPPLDAPLLNRYFDSYIDQGFLSPVAGGDRDSRVTPANRLNRDFFRDILCDYYRDHTIRIRDLSTLPLPAKNSIITELTSWRNGTAAGLSRHRVLIEANNQIVPKSLDLVVKIKPKDHEVLEVGERVAALCGDEVGQAFARFKHRTDAAGSHLREIAIYNQQDDRFVKHVPLVFGAVRNDERHDWILVLESLTGFELMDSAADVSGWQRQHHEAAVRGIAEVHAIWYRRERELLAQSWLGPSMSAAWMAEMADLWTALADHSDRYFSDWIGPDIRRLQQHLISTVGQWWQSLETMPRTLIHNDFNPRNIAFRRTENGLRLCAYDWELATIGVPQHDLAELLCFSLTPAVSRNEVLHLVELHRSALQQATGRRIDTESWRLGFQLSLCDLILNRFPMYCLVHTFRRQQFLQRVIKTWRRVYDVVSAGEAIDRSNTRLSTR